MEVDRASVQKDLTKDGTVPKELCLKFVSASDNMTRLSASAATTAVRKADLHPRCV